MRLLKALSVLMIAATFGLEAYSATTLSVAYETGVTTYIALEDGTAWELPYYSKVSSWANLDQVTIYSAYSNDYPFTLYNDTLYESTPARQIPLYEMFDIVYQTAWQQGVNDAQVRPGYLTILSINGSTVILSDESYYKVKYVDEYDIRDWRVGERMKVEPNRDWDKDLYPFRLVNLEKASSARAE
ncbi:MAG: hypothetical protein SP1CHLAM54_03520 [Chlamydiia bacterium]|nr:hypothetical protein [Chlamydiia bacterium]MCH9615268.1 hypothetical protein [Chlamydiia bacterium]MCH9628410.1 hypothetical protein [Chlamydiia bacterium]